MSDDAAATRSDRSWTWTLAKWALCVLVVVFVGWRAIELFDRDLMSLNVNFGWLVAAGVVYIVGWLPSVWFWRAAMRRMGGDVPFLVAARAYYCGHLGKYIPGKAMVLVIRGQMVAKHGSSMQAGMATAVYETLVMMGAGLALGLALAPRLLANTTLPSWLEWLRWIIDRPVVGPLCVVAVGLAALPAVAKVLEVIARKFVPKPTNGSPSNPAIDLRFLLFGTLVFVVAWMIHGLSLGLTLRSVSADAFAWSDWLIWGGSAAFATSVGFLAIFAPGGVGVREGLMIEMLAVQPGIQPAHAVAAAILLRVVWLTTEVLVSLVLMKLRSPEPVEQ